MTGFHPAADLQAWATETFIKPGGSLHNPDHQHLTGASIGFLWTDIPNSRHMMMVAGQTERPQFQGNKWSRGRQEQQIEAWFGALPDFIITIDANCARLLDDVTFCALVEHELYHCGQQLGLFGEPKFTRDGRPLYAIRGHDVEEFVGIVKRYGAGSSAGQTMALVEAARAKPSVARASIALACGTCKARVT